MCSLYKVAGSREAMRRAFAVMRDVMGELPPSSIAPDSLAPVVRVADGQRQLELMRWGMPAPPPSGGRPVTSIHYPQSVPWRRKLVAASRCLVVATSFCKRANTKPKKTPVWFALDDSQPPFAFAGIWTLWHGTRGTMAKPVEGEHRVFGLLTTEANGIVGSLHLKAMPVLLTNAEEYDVWLRAPWSEAAGLRRPLADEMMKIVGTGARDDRHGRRDAVTASQPDGL